MILSAHHGIGTILYLEEPGCGSQKFPWCTVQQINVLPCEKEVTATNDSPSEVASRYEHPISVLGTHRCTCILCKAAMQSWMYHTRKVAANPSIASLKY